MPTANPPLENGKEALIAMQPGFHFRPPPLPHELSTYITPDADLFQTIHMGAAIVNADRWCLTIDGLVEHPFSITLSELRSMPPVHQTSFHECYGSPLKPPTEFVRRVGNVTWTGVRLLDLLKRAKPLAEAEFVWSDGLDHGKFSTVSADRYQKDLPIEKALSPEVLVAYEINGRPLDLRRGFPVRLIVPGYFGTNSTKWLCRLSLQRERAKGPFTTIFYNELGPGGRTRPVWEVESSSMIVEPRPDEVVAADEEVLVWGWAWSCDGIFQVNLSIDNGESWTPAVVSMRQGFEWQKFKGHLRFRPGQKEIMARATSVNGWQQPMVNRRNCVHVVPVTVRG